jgi:5-methylcytosine-specific restriction enzyme subunit McrC
MAIPVANIYYLLCYAWDEFAPRQMSCVAAEEFPDTLHLFSHLLIVGLRALHRRGLETGYIALEEPTSSVRGRILIRETIRLLAAQPKRIYCSFDEMSADILSNQILKATVKRLLGEESLEPGRRAELRRSLDLLPGVRDIELSARAFHEVRLHQNNRLYLFLINICRFLYECLEPQDQPGRYRFRDVDRDENRMRRIFEKFVRKFFARRQRAFAVTKDRWKWLAAPLGGADLGLLPQMESDVSLRSRDRTIIIECKYTESLYQSRYFSDKLRPAHLYQLCAYLHNLESSGVPNRNAEGILLYPTAGISLDQSYLLHGHHVRVKTLDLNQPWTGIEQEMLALLLPVGNAYSGSGLDRLLVEADRPTPGSNHEVEGRVMVGAGAA